jgi:DNA (cytosine-5)-methyltransferase 1
MQQNLFKDSSNTDTTNLIYSTGTTGYKALNLYAGIGGNRTLWPSNIKITAVEIEPEVAKAYQDRFPEDTVVVGDAHQYLLDNYQNFDFIWTSPPCPTHGQYRYNVGVRAKGYKGLYPDMQLYEEIIFLQYHAKCKWIVENTISYYKPLV